jgi:hypothetical protein
MFKTADSMILQIKYIAKRLLNKFTDMLNANLQAHCNPASEIERINKAVRKPTISLINVRNDSYTLTLGEGDFNYEVTNLDLTINQFASKSMVIEPHRSF